METLLHLIESPTAEVGVLIQSYFLIAEDVLTEADLQPVIDELVEEIDKRAQRLYGEGKIAELHEDAPFDKRYVLLHDQYAEIGKSFDIKDLRGKAMFQFLKNEHLLVIVECLLGSELACNPIQHVRPKLPFVSTDGRLGLFQNVPWHQDAARAAGPDLNSVGVD